MAGSSFKMTEHKQLDDFFKELLNKDVDIKRTWSGEEVEEISDAIKTMTQNIVYDAMENDTIFQRLIKLSMQKKCVEGEFEPFVTEMYELVPVGSVAEGTKIDKPDEQDMLLMLNFFSNFDLEVKDIIYDQKHSFYKHIYLDTEGNKMDEVYEILREASLVHKVKQDDGQCVLNSASICTRLYKILQAELLKAVASERVIKKRLGQLKAMDSLGAMMKAIGKFPKELEFLDPTSAIKRTGPAITLKFLWVSQNPDCHSVIDVDIVPTTVVKTDIDDELTLICDRYTTKNYIHLITVKQVSSLNLYSDKGPGMEKVRIHMVSFLPSHSYLEVQIMRDLPETCRLAYKILKHYITKQFSCSCCKPSNYKFGFIIQTYLMKTMMIRHGNESDSCGHISVSCCVISILREFRDMAAEKRLEVTSLWNQDHNLFLTKPVMQLKKEKPSEWEKEVVNFEKHISYLLQRFAEINEDEAYYFEKYRHFHLKISNRQKRTDGRRKKEESKIKINKCVEIS